MQQRYQPFLGDVDRQYHLFAFIVNFLAYHFESIVELGGITGWQCIHIVLLWLWDQKIDKWYQLQRNATSKLAKFSTRKPARVTLDFHVCWICLYVYLFSQDDPDIDTGACFHQPWSSPKPCTTWQGRVKRRKPLKIAGKSCCQKHQFSIMLMVATPSMCILLWTWKGRWKWKGKAASMLNTWDAQRLRQK